jgi:protein TonB
VRAPKAARPPLPRHDLAAYIHEADYPAAALRDRESGTVRFTLDVGPDGRVTGCTVTRSSGNSWLDSSTCRILRSRARFTPAIDFNGNPTTGRIQQHFTWKLPPHKAR